MKHKVIAMNLLKNIRANAYKTSLIMTGDEIKLDLPEGCIGILCVFESKKMARKEFGNNVELLKIDYSENKNVENNKSS